MQIADERSVAVEQLPRLFSFRGKRAGNTVDVPTFRIRPYWRYE